MASGINRTVVVLSRPPTHDLNAGPDRGTLVPAPLDLIDEQIPRLKVEIRWIVPGYRLRDTSDVISCGCSRQDPERTISNGLVLTRCANCGGLVTHERKPRDNHLDERDAYALGDPKHPDRRRR
jgi:hypothetical protein